MKTTTYHDEAGPAAGVINLGNQRAPSSEDSNNNFSRILEEQGLRYWPARPYSITGTHP
jgi:hypothetical protein